MDRLRQGELERLQVFLQRTSEPCDISVFVEHTLPAIDDLVGGDVVCHAEMEPLRAKLVSQTTYAAGIEAPDYFYAFERYMMDAPIVQYWASSGDTRACRTSDFVSRREWHKSNLYQYVYKQWRCEDSLAIGLPAPPGMVGVFCIERSKPFTDRERLLMEIVRPHLANAYRNAEAFSLMGLATSAEGTESMLLDAHARPLLVSTGAWELIEHYFPAYEAAPSGLPEQLDRWVRRQMARFELDEEVAPPADPLRVLTEGGSALTIRMMNGARTGEQSLVVFHEQRQSEGGRIHRGLGLTPREEEVLTLAMRGESSSTIADVLCISRRTVDKHFENIFNKLGVDSRSAAVARALETAAF